MAGTPPVGDLRKVLAGTVLGGCQVSPTDGDVILVAGLEQTPEALLEAWRAARGLVKATGRWPVLIGVDEILGAPSAAELTELEASVPAQDPWLVLDAFVDELPLGRDDLVAWEGELGDAELLVDAEGQLGFPTTWPAFDRWVYERALASAGLMSRAMDRASYWTGTQSWLWGLEAQLVFLPTTRSWLAPAWLSFLGAAGQTLELSAAMWQWDQLYGAELVASWGTVLEFFVARSPALGEQAWKLAGQLKALGGNLGMPRWELALALTSSDAWFLHDRP
jgi:hypothetical protein